MRSDCVMRNRRHQCSRELGLCDTAYVLVRIGFDISVALCRGRTYLTSANGVVSHMTAGLKYSVPGFHRQLVDRQVSEFVSFCFVSGFWFGCGT